MTAERAKNRHALAVAVREEQKRIRGKALDDIRAEIGRIHERRRHVLLVVASHCQRARRTLAEKVRAYRAEERARVNRVVETWRAEERARCGARRLAVRGGVESLERQAREKLAAERREQSIQRRAEKRRAREEERSRRSFEARRESDDEVRSNIGPELVPVFDAVRGSIRSAPGRSRTEAFLHWVEEHEGEVWAIQEKAAEQKLRALLLEEKRAARDVRKCGGSCGSKAFEPVRMIRELRAEGRSLRDARRITERVSEEIAAGDRRDPKAIAAHVIYRWEEAPIPF